MSEKDKNEKRFHDYLGDAVYIYLTPARQVVIYTSDGLGILNTIYFEDFVLDALLRWVDRVKAEMAREESA